MLHHIQPGAVVCGISHHCSWHHTPRTSPQQTPRRGEKLFEAAVPCMHIRNQAYLGLLTSSVVEPVQVPSQLAHCHLQIRDSVIWTPSSPPDTDGETEAPCGPQSETLTQAQLLHAACSCECAVLASLCLSAAACHRAGPQPTSHPHADIVASLSHPAQCLPHSFCWPVGLHACTLTHTIFTSLLASQPGSVAKQMQTPMLLSTYSMFGCSTSPTWMKSGLEGYPSW